MLRRRRNPEGRMSLADHLRELRRRLVIAGIAIALASVIGWLRYDWLLTQLTAPLDVVRHQRHGSLVGVIIASPVWLYELWAFIVPGLTRRERRTAAAFIAAAVPLFLGGCYLALWALPQAVEVLLGFTPSGAVNLTNASDYLSFVTRFILAFGLAFLLPVLLVALNAANVLPARVMLK